MHFLCQQKDMLALNNMRVKKSWQNCHFSVNCSFKSVMKICIFFISFFFFFTKFWESMRGQRFKDATVLRCRNVFRFEYGVSKWWHKFHFWVDFKDAIRFVFVYGCSLVCFLGFVIEDVESLPNISSFSSRWVLKGMLSVRKHCQTVKAKQAHLRILDSFQQTTAFFDHPFKQSTMANRPLKPSAKRSMCAPLFLVTATVL